MYHICGKIPFSTDCEQEVLIMTEQTGIMDKPKQLWDGAMKMVKGEDTHQLMEQFTSEMTLVAEGLCEDQGRLHQEVERMMREEDQRIQKLEARINLLERTLDEERSAHDRELTEARNRFVSLEKKTEKAERENARNEEREKEKKQKKPLIRDLTVLIGIAGGSWVLVTLLNLVRDLLR